MSTLLPYLAVFLKALALVPLTLLPIINPLSGAPIFAQTAGNNPTVVKLMARQVAIFGIKNDSLNTAVNVALLVLVVVWFALIFWTFADARRRIDLMRVHTTSCRA